MNPFEMVVLIVAIVMIASILKSRHRSRAGQPADDGEARRLREEVRTLKERVAVLERLITDERGSRDLSREIEALRSRDA